MVAVAAANRLELTASIEQISPLRFTPSGVPAINFVVVHESEMLEAGTSRKVSLTMKAVAFGTLGEQIVRLPLGQIYSFNGFMASARTNKSVVFHIQEFKPIQSI